MLKVTTVAQGQATATGMAEVWQNLEMGCDFVEVYHMSSNQRQWYLTQASGVGILKADTVAQASPLLLGWRNSGRILK